EAVKTHLFSQPLFPVVPAFEFVPLADRVTLPQQGVLTHCRLNHPGGSLGFRIDWPGRSMAYITTTIAAGTYLAFSPGGGGGGGQQNGARLQAGGAPPGAPQRRRPALPRPRRPAESRRRSDRD